MTRDARRARTLRHEIAAALAAKVVALLILYAVFFSSVPRLPGVSEHLFHGDEPAPVADSHRARQ